MFTASRALVLSLALLQIVPATSMAQFANSVAVPVPQTAEEQKAELPNLAPSQDVIAGKKMDPVVRALLNLDIEPVIEVMGKVQDTKKREYLVYQIEKVVVTLTPQQQVVLFDSLLNSIDTASSGSNAVGVIATAATAFVVVTALLSKAAGKSAQAGALGIVSTLSGFVAWYGFANAAEIKMNLSQLRQEIVALRAAADSICQLEGVR